MSSYFMRILYNRFRGGFRRYAFKKQDGKNYDVDEEEVKEKKEEDEEEGGDLWYRARNLRWGAVRNKEE